MRTLMAVAAVLVLAVAGVGGYVMLTNDNGQDPGDGGAGETGPQYTDADMRWNAVLEEVPTNEGHSTLIHPTIYCPPGMEGQMVRLTVEGRGDGGVQYILLPGTNIYRPGAYLNTVELSEVRISLNGQPLPLDPTLQTSVQ